MAADSEIGPLDTTSARIASETAPARSLGEIARTILKQRRAFEHLFGEDLFADATRDILLDLFAAGEEGNRVTVSSCCIAANVPSTTGLRYIRLLKKRGLIVSYSSGEDGRVSFLDLSPDTRAVMATNLTTLGLTAG